jgi:hypothetical protein
MSILDPESLMFSLPSDELEIAFIRAANAAGYFGLDVYSYHIELGQRIKTEEEKLIDNAAKEMAYEAGCEIRKLYEEAYDDHPKD